MSRLLALGTSVLCVVAVSASADIPTRITDGDTIRFGEERVRLWGIDAPELRQTCWIDGEERQIGIEAREAIATLIGDGDVECDPVDVDRYGRVVALCRVGGLDLAEELVRQSLAWEDLRFSDGSYTAAEEEALAAGAGVWAGECEPAWEWRRR